MVTICRVIERVKGANAFKTYNSAELTVGAQKCWALCPTSFFELSYWSKIILCNKPLLVGTGKKKELFGLSLRLQKRFVFSKLSLMKNAHSKLG